MTIKFDFITGIESTEIPEVGGDPLTPHDLISKSYVDKNLPRGVATLAALKALDSNSRSENQLIFVQDLNALFYYQGASVAAGNDVSVVAPNDGVGRWLRANSTGQASSIQLLDAQGKPSSETVLAKIRGGSGQDNSNLTFPSAGTLATLAGSETLLNKSLAASTITNYLDLSQQSSAPAAPSAGYDRFYFKNDGKVYKKNSSNVESELGSGGGGSGQGEKNYISPNGDAEINALTGWTVVGSNLTLSVQTANILEGAYSFRLAKAAASAQNSYLKFAFTVEQRHLGRILRIKLPYLPSANFADGDLKVSIYDVTNSVSIEPAPTTVLKTLINNDFIAEFQVPVNSTSYELRLTVSTASALQWDFDFDSVFVGPGPRAFGSASTDWQAYPTAPAVIGFGTLSVNSWFWRREGSECVIRGNITCGTPTAVQVQLPLPPGLTSSSNITAIQLVGNAGRQNAYGSATTVLYTAIYASRTYLSITANRGDTGWTPVTPRLGTDLTGANEAWTFNARVPIEGWQTQQLQSSEADTRVCAARAYATANRVINNTTVCNFDFVDYDTHGAITTGSSWNFKAPMPGLYRVSVSTFASPAAGTSTAIIVNGVVKASLTECGTSGQFSGSCVLRLNAGDLVAMRGVQATSATLVHATNPFGLAIQIDRLTGPAQISASEQVRARFTSSVAQAINATAAQVQMATKDYDSHSAFAAHVFTAPRSGFVKCSIYLRVSVGSASGAGAIVRKNSVNFARTATGYISGAGPIGMGGSTSVSVIAGDKLDFVALSDAAGTLTGGTTDNYVEFEML